MVYRVIGLMSGSSLDGLDIACVELQEQGGKWNYSILSTDCYAYSNEWSERLKRATELSALDYQLLHIDYGHYIGEQVNHFIKEHGLEYKISLISSHGHTTFHMPEKKMTAQLGDGAAIAAETRLPVVTDLRSLDLALGGQGAPIVPIGEKLLLGNYRYFLNLGGIANISLQTENNTIAFDISPANRVLNLLAIQEGKEFDEGGKLAASGTINEELLNKLNSLSYYQLPWPKSLANDFGTTLIFPMISAEEINNRDALRTFTEHIAVQIKNSVSNLESSYPIPIAIGIDLKESTKQMLVTGGGAFNNFMVDRIRDHLKNEGIEVVVPAKELVNFKEALIMAFIGILRWRQEYNVLSSVTGAERDSIGGALWNGQEA